MNKNWILDHVGHAVFDLEAAIAWYVKTSGSQVIEREDLPSSGVAAAFIDVGGCLIELIAPLGSNSVLSKFLDTRGEGIHHICYRVSDIRAELLRLKADGYTLIDEKPRPGSRHTEIAFLHPKSAQGVLVELAAAIADHPL